MAWYDYVPGGNMIDSFLHPERGYEAAADQMKQSFNQAASYERPYAQAGLRHLGPLGQARSNLMHPQDMLNNWMQSYQTSPYAQRTLEEANQSGLDAASSMGLLGSSAALRNAQNTSHDIMNADRQQYLNDLMDKYMKGVGISGDIYKTGAQVGTQFGNQAIGVGESLGQSAFGQQNAPGDILNQFLKILAQAGAKKYLGGGFLGGATGAT